MKTELLTSIPQVVAEARNQNPLDAEVKAALAGRMDYVGPRLAIVRVLSVINEAKMGEPFRKAMLGLKSARYRRGDRTDLEDIKFGVMAVGESDYLAVGSYTEKAKYPFCPVVVIGREGSYTANPRLHLMRRDWEDSLQLQGLFIESETADQVVEGLLKFIAQESQDKGLLITARYDPGIKGTFYDQFNPNFKTIYDKVN